MLNKLSTHQMYSASIVLASIILVGYMVWNNIQLKLQNEERKVRIERCLNQAENLYEISLEKACSNLKNYNCKNVLAHLFPNLLKDMADRLNKDREICVAINS